MSRIIAAKINSKKKSLKHPKRDEKKRMIFCHKIHQYMIEGRNIVYLDESGFAKEAVRSHGYLLKGHRCFGQHNWNEKGRVNAIGALLEKVLLTVCLFTGSINSDIFCEWVKQDLLPKLPLNSVVVMDNASFHKRKDIQDAIKDENHTLEYLPTYSPDLNPIEKKWAEVKSKRKKFRCDPVELFRDFVL